MPEAVCGYYGKLPVSPEFLRFHATGPEVRELDDWLERGIQYAKARAGSEWSTLVTQADIWNFLFVPEREGRVVCGAVFASRDRAGRSFPFLTFLLMDCPRVPPAPWLIPLQCRLFLEKTRQLLQQLRVDLDWDAFRARALLLDPEIDPDALLEAGFQDYLASTTVTEFWNGLSDPCLETAQPARDVPRRPTSDLSDQVGRAGWRLPLLRGCKAETYDIPFWLECHARWSAAAVRPLSAAIAFWNRHPSKVDPCVLLSIGCPPPQLATFIVSPDVRDEAWGEGTGWLDSARVNLTTSSRDDLTQTSMVGDLSLQQYLDTVC